LSAEVWQILSRRLHVSYTNVYEDRDVGIDMISYIRSDRSLSIVRNLGYSHAHRKMAVTHMQVIEMSVIAFSFILQRNYITVYAIWT
jgi:hypothetical protein